MQKVRQVIINWKPYLNDVTALRLCDRSVLLTDSELIEFKTKFELYHLLGVNITLAIKEDKVVAISDSNAKEFLLLNKRGEKKWVKSSDLDCSDFDFDI